MKNLLKDGTFGLMILGGDHDLSENVRRLGGGRCEYVRVTMGRYRDVAGNSVARASGHVVHDRLDIHERVIVSTDKVVFRVAKTGGYGLLLLKELIGSSG